MKFAEGQFMLHRENREGSWGSSVIRMDPV